MKKIFVLIAVFVLAAGPLLAQNQIIDSVLFIAEGTTSIKSQAYYGKTNFNKVVIPESVKKIGSLAFHSCSKLKEVEIPASVDTIGNAAFQNCTSLTQVTLHNGLKNLSYRIFKGTAISEITIPASVTEFGNEIFASCDSLTTIRVDKYSEAHAFYNTDSRMQLTDNEPVQTKEQWIATAKYSIIEDGILYVGLGVTKINDNQYKDNQNIKEIHFKDTVTQMAGIGTSAFRNCTGLTKVVIPGNVKNIGDWAFAGCSNLEEIVFEEGVQKLIVYAFVDCPKLQSVTLPKSIQSIKKENILTENKSTRIFHCWLGSEACSVAMNNGNRVDIIGIDEENIESIDLTHLSLSNTTVKAGLFKNLEFEIIDLCNELVEIGENAFNDKTILRVKRNTAGDNCLKSNGYFLCGVLADLNFYTKNKSKEIVEDFTRILCDDSPYAEWTACSFSTQEPLKLEEIDDKLVLTSYMVYPCENVTVTDKNGKALISNKTIQPLTRTVLCDFDFLTDSVGSYTLTTDDELYKRLTSIPIKWNISYSGFVRRVSTDEKSMIVTMRPVFAREYIGGIFNVAYIMGMPEYERRCYEAVENKTLVTDEALTVPLTKEQMEALLKKTKEWSLCLGRDNGGGTGGGNWLTMARDFIIQFALGKPSAFWHEFSHCMGWAHEQGNMCYEGRPEPYNVDWPSIGSYLYQEEYKKGTTPYTYDKYYFNTYFFSGDELPHTDMADDTVINEVLYVTKGMPYIDSHKNQTDFTKVEVPSSVEVIDGSAFYGTAITEFTLTSNIVRIKKQAFQNCADLKGIVIPDNVKEIGNAAFQNCTSLTSAEIGSGLRELNYRLFKGSGLTEITIPSNIKVIGKEAFQDCKNLKSVVIGDGVRKIGDNAFRSCAIDTIQVPASVTELGSNITSKTVVWVVERGSAAYYNALENNYPIVLLPESEESVAAQIIAESATADSASISGWQTGDFEKTYARYRWDFSGELKGAGNYTVTFKYTGGSCMLCLTDALFVADGKAIAHFFERRTAGNKPRQIVYEITVPAGTEKLELLALAKTDGGTESKGAVKVEYLGGGEEQDNENQGGNENQGNENQGGNENQEEENQNENNNENQGENNNENNTQTSVTESVANINIYAYNRTIIVENATSEIRVYDVMGRLICRDATPCVRTEIPMEKSGVYVVKVGNLAKRVIVE